MKKFFLIFALLAFMATNAYAFLYDVPILSKEEIAKLSDQVLQDDYIEAAIELEASKTFHGKAGFTPKEYEMHKNLLRYIVYLKMEMQKRELEPAPVDEMVK